MSTDLPEPLPAPLPAPLKARIHFARIGKPEALYVEDLVDENPLRIITHNRIPAGFRKVWSKDVWIEQGIMNGGEVVCEVRKHHFYQEWFDIIELFGEDGRLIGYYCDIITPLQKAGDGYYLKDLLLDLWIFPDGRTVELDWDEFEAAARQGLITSEEQAVAMETLRWLVEETRQGRFPARYLE